MNPSDYVDFKTYGEHFALLLDGKLSAEQSRALEQRLAEDHKLRRFYLQYIQVHAMLRSELEGRYGDGDMIDPAETLGSILGDSDESFGDAEAAPGTATGPTQEQQTPAAPPVGQNRRAGSMSLFKFTRYASVIAASILLAVMLFGSWRMYKQQEPALARVTDSHEAAWTVSWSDLQNPENVTAGDLTLLAGQLELTFPDGTVATLDAPTQVNLVSQSHLRLTRGRVYIAAPQGHTGFQVSTPGATATDLGTEFGVVYTHDFVTDVHVFKGAVSLSPSRHRIVGSAEPADLAVTLHEGDAGQIDSNAELTQGMTADASLFVRDIDQIALNGNAPPPTYESWLAFRDRLRSDPDLVACYDFTWNSRTPDKLKNIAMSTGTRLNGSLGDPSVPLSVPQWVKGRFPSSHALRFESLNKQFVTLPADESLRITGDLTTVWWMKPMQTYNKDFSMVVLGFGSPRTDEHGKELERDNHLYAHGLKLGKLRAFHESGQGINQEVTSTTEIQRERWTHVAIVRDVAKRQYRLYIDGQLSDAIEYKSNVTGGESPLAAVTIGRSGGAVLNHFDGTLDEMMIFSRCLTGQEVQAMYHKSRPPSQ